MSLHTISLDTDGNRLFDITPQLDQLVADHGAADGLAVVWVPHTTAAVGVVSFPDPKGLEDVVDEINRLIPTRIDFKHQHDTPQDAAGHVKSAILGPSLTLIVDAGRIMLGHSQKVFFFEFDGPRSRQVVVKVVSA